MNYRQLSIKIASIGDVVNHKIYGLAKVTDATYNNNLNWYTYTIKTEFGLHKIENNGVLSVNGIKTKCLFKQ